MSDDRYRIAWSDTQQAWNVYRLGEHPRFVRSFPTLLEAEEYAIRGRVLTPEERADRNVRTAAVVNRLLDFHGGVA